MKTFIGIFSLLFAVGCGQAGTGDTPVDTSTAETGDTPVDTSTAAETATDWSKKTFYAKDVVLGSSNYNLTDSETGEVVKIRPEQILLSDSEETVGRLKSKNLKDALETEVAVSLKDTIVGTWEVENKGTKHKSIADMETVVSFTDTNIIVDVGLLGIVEGYGDRYVCPHMPVGFSNSDISYELISPSVMMVTTKTADLDTAIYIVSVNVINKDHMVLYIGNEKRSCQDTLTRIAVMKRKK